MRRIGVLGVLLLAGCAPQLKMGDLSVSVPPPAVPGTADTLVFVAFGDNRLSRGDQDLAYDSARRGRRRAVVEAIAAAAPGFVIHTGDLVERGSDPKRWAAFEEDSRPILRPRFFYPVAGNHEYKGGFPGEYFRLFSDTVGQAKSYAFQTGPAYFIVFDSMVEPGVTAEDTSTAHARWFRERLAEAEGSRFVFVVLHHPVFSSGRGRIARFLLFDLEVGHAARPKERRLRKLLADHLEKRRDADPLARTVVLSGHSHFYAHYVYRDVDFFVTGGGGAPMHSPAEGTPEHRVAAYRGDHFVLFWMTQTGLSFELRPVGPGRWFQEPPSLKEGGL